MPFRRVLIRGLMFVRGPRDRPEGPVDPDYGIDEGEPDHPGIGGGPVIPGRPGHGLPWPGRPVDPGWGWGGGERPGHGLPWPGRPVDPDYGIEGGEVGGGPIRPGRPGHPLPRPPIPVVQVLPVEEGMEVPTGAPHEPGCLVVAYAGKSAPKAIGWLQGAGDLPEARVPPPSGTPAGHWVPVEVDPAHAVCRDTDPDAVGWCYVFEIGADFGKLRPTPKR